MLQSELRTMSDAVKAAFKREGPLRISHFKSVAKAFDLPMPSFGKTQLRCVKDTTGNVLVGQFANVTNNFPCGANLNGIVRRFNREGNFLSEYMEINGSKVGLSRHIDLSGHVTYIVKDSNGKRIDTNTFDPQGNTISNPLGILIKSNSHNKAPKITS